MKRSLRPSPSMIVAVVALFAALGATAWALTSGSVKARHIAADAVRDKHLKNQDTIKLRKLSPSATNADQGAAQAAATKVGLYRDGGFRIYAKCFKSTEDPSNPGMHGLIFLEAGPGAVFSGDERDSGNGFLQPGDPESDRVLLARASFAGPGDPGTLNAIDADAMPFYAAQGQRFIEGALIAATKVGNPAVGNGVFGAGDKCLFAGTVRSG